MKFAILNFLLYFPKPYFLKYLVIKLNESFSKKEKKSKLCNQGLLKLSIEFDNNRVSTKLSF